MFPPVSRRACMGWGGVEVRTIVEGKGHAARVQPGSLANLDKHALRQLPKRRDR